MLVNSLLHIPSFYRSKRRSALEKSMGNEENAANFCLHCAERRKCFFQGAL